MIRLPQLCIYNYCDLQNAPWTLHPQMLNLHTDFCFENAFRKLSSLFFLHWRVVSLHRAHTQTALSAVRRQRKILSWQCSCIRKPGRPQEPGLSCRPCTCCWGQWGSCAPRPGLHPCTAVWGELFIYCASSDWRGHLTGTMSSTGKTMILEVPLILQWDYYCE